MLLISNGTIVGSKGSRKANLLIDGEKIVRISSEDLSAEVGGAKEIDASGKLIFPGFIDAHTHFDLHVAGTVTCDDFASGTKAAVAGGTTMIIDFGTQYKGETLLEGKKNWDEKAAAGCSADYSYHMSITDWNEEAHAQCADMMKEGLSTFKVYMTYDTQLNDEEIYEILVRLMEVGAFTGCHCENAGMIDALRKEYSADERLKAVSSHYKTRPAEAEAEAIDRYCHLAEVAGAAIMDVHLTCEAGLNEIREARKRGVRVYAETCPQYLVMDDSLYELPGFEGAKYVIAPPLRKKSDQEALWQAIADGEIQTICTDHCAFTLAQKELGKEDFKKIPGGMPGVETRAEVMYSEGVAKGRITREKLAEVCAENVARLYGCYPEKGIIAEGSDADLFILDPNAKKTITVSDQVSKCDYAPLEGMEITGVIEQVFLRGELVAEHGRVIRENTGRFIKRHAPEMFDL